jgi:ribosome-associated translation inhibitor RaiA
MNIRIFHKNMKEHSEGLDERCRTELARIQEFLTSEPTPITIDLTLAPSHVHAHHKIELRIKSPNYHVVSTYEGPDFYLTLNRVIDTAYLQLHEDKQRLVDRRKSEGRHDEFKKQR